MVVLKEIKFQQFVIWEGVVDMIGQIFNNFYFKEECGGPMKEL